MQSHAEAVKQPQRGPAGRAGASLADGGIMARRKSVRSQLYRSARVLGDLEAARKGPGAYARRRVRRVMYRKGNRGMARVLKALGL